MTRFRDRSDAGRQLAQALREHAAPDVVVVGIARGGVPVAYEVAHRLSAPLDVVVIRKLGLPGQEELAMGAVGPGGTQVRNAHVLHLLHVPEPVIQQVADRELREAETRERAYRRGRTPEPLGGRAVILVDDGLATGASMRTAVRAVRALDPARIVVAVPTGSPATCDMLREDADEVLCLTSTDWFFAVGQFYEEFPETSDDEVRELLSRAAHEARDADDGNVTHAPAGR
ncbi:MAG: phosphoribosyltransferase [Polyangiaceae bacterium]|nr:phosphoribosyltransferase [Polyangiaceae bacterium]